MILRGPHPQQPALGASAPPDTEMAEAVAFLRDLAERLRHVPVMYGTDDYDIDRLHDLARKLEPSP